MTDKVWRYTIDGPLPESDWQLPGGPLPPELLAILHQRGIDDAETAAAHLSPEHYHPALPSQLPDLDRAIAILSKLIAQENAHVLVWGDFDADGQTSTAILVEGLQRLGLDVSYYIPNRQRESHGVHLSSLVPMLNEQSPDLLLVCDTGSADVEAIAHVKSLGIPTIIADHHELPETLPPADALINPLRLQNENHPLRTLSGVGVSYLLLQALYTAQNRASEARRFLDLVAIGLVADVVELINDTRYLVQLGLRALHKTERPGLIALCRQFSINPATLTESDIGFRVAPALNALGRLDTAEKAVELLTTTDPVTAQQLAQEADGLNRRRRMLTDQVYAAAQEQIERDPTLLNWESLVLSSPNWHSGVVGIVAARLAETYHKPVAMLVTADDGSMRGSLRSIPGYHVGEALAQLDSILLKYGGHEGAGGLSVDGDNAPLLRRRLSQAFADVRQDVPPDEISIDGQLSLENLSLDFAYQLRRLAPFGAGNPQPIFVTPDLSTASTAKLGKNNQHRRVTVQDREGHRQTVFWWNSADEPLLDGRFDLAYTIDISTYREVSELQVTLVDWQQIEAPTPDPVETAEIIDFRTTGHALDALDDIRQQETDLAVWAEGFPASKSPGFPLSQLQPAAALVILTAPTGFDHIVHAINAVQPARVYLVAAPSPIDSLPAFLKTLRGLVKTVVNSQDGKTTLTQLRERLGVNEQLVRLGLDYLLGDNVTISPRGNVHITAADFVENDISRLQHAWDELAAFRRYIRRTDPTRLLD